MSECFRKRCRRHSAGRMCPEHSNQAITETDLIDRSNNEATVISWGEPGGVESHDWREARLESELVRQIEEFEAEEESRFSKWRDLFRLP